MSDIPPSLTPPSALPPSGKKSPWLYVGLGCLGIVLIVVISTVVLVGMGAKKLAQYGREASANPEKFAAELIIKANPEMEIVTSDPKTSQMTIREKATGQEMTFTYSEIANGKFTMKSDNKVITIDGSQGGMVIKEGDKTTEVKAGTNARPDWIPAYPGWKITPDSDFQVKADDENRGSIAATTADPILQVGEYFKNTLKKEGYVCEETTASVGDMDFTTVVARNAATGRDITVSVQKEKAQTDAEITLVYKSKQP